MNLCSPSLSVSESGNEELCSELSPSLVEAEADKRSRKAECSTPQGLTNDDEVGVQSVDGVSNSPYTSSNFRTDGQPTVGRGLPSNDEMLTRIITIPTQSVRTNILYIFLTSSIYGALPQTPPALKAGPPAKLRLAHTASRDVLFLFLICLIFADVRHFCGNFVTARIRHIENIKILRKEYQKRDSLQQRQKGLC